MIPDGIWTVMFTTSGARMMVSISSTVESFSNLTAKIRPNLHDFTADFTLLQTLDYILTLKNIHVKYAGNIVQLVFIIPYSLKSHFLHENHQIVGIIVIA